MSVRFARVREFLDYLQREEQAERAQFLLQVKGGVWGSPFVPPIRHQIEREIAWIERRLRENRECVVDDVRIEADGDNLGPDVEAEADDAEPQAG